MPAHSNPLRFVVDTSLISTDAHKLCDLVNPYEHDAQIGAGFGGDRYDVDAVDDGDECAPPAAVDGDDAVEDVAVAAAAENGHGVVHAGPHAMSDAGGFDDDC